MTELASSESSFDDKVLTRAHRGLNLVDLASEKKPLIVDYPLISPRSNLAPENSAPPVPNPQNDLHSIAPVPNDNRPTYPAQPTWNAKPSEAAAAGFMLATRVRWTSNMFFGGPGQETYNKSYKLLDVVAHENDIRSAKLLAIPALGLALYSLKTDASELYKSPSTKEALIGAAAVTADLLAATGAAFFLNPRTQVLGVPIQMVAFGVRAALGIAEVPQKNQPKDRPAAL
jgi:hypothetical protein